jgi:hypothetical protein
MRNNFSMSKAVVPRLDILPEAQKTPVVRAFFNA